MNIPETSNFNPNVAIFFFLLFFSLSSFPISSFAVTPGSRNQCLWGLLYNDGTYDGGCAADAPLPQFSWSQASCTLTISYSNSSTTGCALNTTAVFQALPTNAAVPNAALFAATLTLQLNSACTKQVREVLWLSDVIIDPTAVSNVFLPILPGINLNAGFFARSTPRIYQKMYPGQSVFADLFSLTTNTGASWAYLTPRTATDPVKPALLAISGQAANDWFIHHSYQMVLHPGGTYQTPPLWLAVGHYYTEVSDQVESFGQTFYSQRPAAFCDHPAPPTHHPPFCPNPLKQLAAFYYNASDAASYPTLRSKLGSQFSSYASSPLVKVDAVGLNVTFDQYPQLVETFVERPALLHVTSYEPVGFDRYYPVRKFQKRVQLKRSTTPVPDYPS